MTELSQFPRIVLPTLRFVRVIRFCATCSIADTLSGNQIDHKRRQMIKNTMYRQRASVKCYANVNYLFQPETRKGNVFS